MSESETPGPNRGSSSQDAVVIFITKVWLVAAGVVNQALLAWFLAPDGRGAYAVCMIFGTSLSLFFTLASDRAAQYFIMSKRQTLSEGAAVALAFAFLGSLTAVVVGYALIESGLSYFEKADRSDFLLALVLIPLTAFEFALNMQLSGLRRFLALGFISVLRTALNMALFVLFIWVLDLGVTGGLISLAIGLLIAVLASLFVLIRWCGLRFALPKWEHSLSVLTYGIRYYLARLGPGLDRNLSIIFLGLLASQEQIGLFAAAVGMMFRVHVFSQSIEPAIVPRIAESGESRAPLAEQAARVSGLLTFGAVGLVVLFSYPIVRIILSPAFLPAVPLIWILGIGAVIYGYSKVLMAYLRATNRPGAVSWVIASSLAVNGVAIFALYPVLGVSAAAWSITLAMLARTVLILAFYKHATGRGPLKAIMPRWDDLVVIKSELSRLAAKFVGTWVRARQ